jgi:hypothetical protein
MQCRNTIDKGDNMQGRNRHLVTFQDVLKVERIKIVKSSRIVIGDGGTEYSLKVSGAEVGDFVIIESNATMLKPTKESRLMKADVYRSQCYKYAR